MKLSFRRFCQGPVSLGLYFVAATFASACLQRPVGIDQPKTTNVIVSNLEQSSVDKIDLLFMIDNSLSMGDKQKLLAQALPDLVNRLVDPVCVPTDPGPAVKAMGGSCPEGYAREFQPVDNIHIGVITSSLGGFGAELDCNDAEAGQMDDSRLLGSLDRVRAELPNTPDFLTWCKPGSDSATHEDCSPTLETSNGDAAAFSLVFQDQVEAARERGCGWESSLEAWYRFLIEPNPWTRVVRQNCPFGGDTKQLCVGPERDPMTTLPRIDETIIAQRKAFLRADSLLAIVMLTDENDCSFKASGQSWRLSETKSTTQNGQVAPTRAYRGSAACATNPNDPCCVSCGTGPTSGCPTATNANGDLVNAGCEEKWYPSADDLSQAGIDTPTDDAINLRCFDQKRRFGVDYLYPVARYSNALKLDNICPFADDLDPNATASDGSLICGAKQELVVPNPLFRDLTYEDRRALDMNAQPVPTRPHDLVFLAGIVGVPWQDLAVDRAARTLVYKTNNTDSTSPTIDWVQLLGSADRGAPYDLMNAPPGDPLMREQIEPRTGTDTSINGGEWNILGRDDLQYACTFPLDEPEQCPDSNDTGNETVACDCTYYGDASYDNPLCNGLEQTHAKAYPSIRELQVLRDYGKNSIVASICPKNTTDDTADDFGYRPAVAAIVERLRDKLSDKCLPRTLEVKDEGNGPQANCLIVEADQKGGTTCDASKARTDVQGEFADKVYERLQRTNYCSDVNGDCRQFHLCEITPIRPNSGDYQSCLSSDNSSGDGWCYIDPAQGLGTEDQVAKCPETEKRKIRFAGAGAPSKGTVTFFACAGAPQSGTTVEATDMSTTGL